MCFTFQSSILTNGKNFSLDSNTILDKHIHLRILVRLAAESLAKKTGQTNPWSQLSNISKPPT